MTKREIEEIINQLKSYIDSVLNGYGQSSLTFSSFEKDYMKYYSGKESLRQDTFRIFLRSLEDMFKESDDVYFYDSYADFPKEGTPKKIYVSKKETTLYTWDNEYIPLGGISSYESEIKDKETIVPESIGGIEAGTKLSQLEGKTFGQMFDYLLFPEINPTVQNPYASISFVSFSNNGIYKVGAAAPVKSNFSTSFNRGLCSVVGQPSKNRAGELDLVRSFIYYGSVQQELPTEIPLGQTTYRYRAYHEQGDTLLTSKGNVATKDANGSPITNPLPAGYVDSNAISIFGTYPYISNGKTTTDAIDKDYPTEMVEAELPLQKWSDTKVNVKYASEASTGIRAMFKFPATRTIVKVELKDDLSGDWSDVTSSFTQATSAGTVNVEGNEIAYSSITTNNVSLLGNCHYRFTLNTI